MNDVPHARLPEHFASAKDTGTLAARLTRARAQARLFGAGNGSVAIGRFELTEMLGAGGMGSVFAARDTELDREVALKFLHAPDGVGLAALRKHLRREARALAAVTHPNVVVVHTIEEADGHVFIAMARVRGATLRTWLAGQPPRARIIALFRTIADALHTAHGAGVVHGDFKPENVMVTEEGRARVLDFGLASAVAHVVAHSEPGHGPGDETAASGGTPAYAAPELVAGAERDARSDQFAFCCTLHEALTGELPPHAGPGDADDIPKALRRLLERGMKADPGDRWRSLGEVRDRLAPAPKRARWIVAGGLLAAGAAGLWVPDRAPSRCAGPGASLAGEWHDARRARIREAFEATALPYAAAAFARASTGVDAWVQRWRERYAQACEDGRQAHVKATLACLTAGRHALRSTLSVWDGADALAVSRVDEALRALGEPQECGVADSSSEPLPDEVVRMLSEAKAFEATGRYAEGIEALGKAGPTLDAAGPRAHLEHLYRLGELLMRDGQYEAAEDALSRCYHLSVDLDDDASAGSAALYLTATVGERLARHDDGLQWGRHAQAALERSGADADAMAALNNSVGGILYRAGDFAPARARFESAVRQWTDAWGPDSTEVAVALDNLGVTMADLAEFDEALGRLERSLEIREAHYGAHHPEVATSLHNLGVIQVRMGRYAEAEPRLTRAAAIRKESLGGEHPEYAKSLVIVGDIASGLGDYDAAEASYREAAKVSVAALGDNHPAAAGPLTSLGNIAFYRDDPQTARTH